MLKMLFFTLKVALFSVLVLFLGSWLTWDGKTVSDQIKTHLAHSESTSAMDEIKSLGSSIGNWARQITGDARKANHKKLKLHSASISPEDMPASDEISSSERQKLKALITELNHAHRPN